MKKAYFHRRIRTLWHSVREYFLEEEPHDKARRTMQEATKVLNRTIYQRMALEYEYQHGQMDEEARMWCRQSLKQLREAERSMCDHLATLRDKIRTLTLQNLFYKSLRQPDEDCFEAALDALMELQAAVRAEQTLESIPRLVAAPTDASTSDLSSRLS